MKSSSEWTKQADGTWVKTNAGGDDITVGWDPSKRHQQDLEVTVQLRAWGDVTVYIPRNVLEDLTRAK